MKVLFHLKNMKVWVVVLAIIFACWLSTVEQQRRRRITTTDRLITTTKNHENVRADIMKVKFTTKGATRNSYLMFMKDLYNALTARAGRGGDVPVLPNPLRVNDPRQYVLVELTNGAETVTFVLNVSDVYVLGYHARGSPNSYFFQDVPRDDLPRELFPNTAREALTFTGRYGALETAAGVGDRREIPLGMDVLRQHIQYMNDYELDPATRGHIARGLIVTIQMVSEAVRLRNFQQHICAVADPDADGNYGVYYPDGLMMEYQTAWTQLAVAIQSASANGMFRRPIQLVYDGIVVILDTVRQVLFTIAIMSSKCNNLRLMPSSSEFPSLLSTDTGLEGNDDTCEIALAPTSYITGRNGKCIDVYQGKYHNGNKIILWDCGHNQANQLWTFVSYDGTIRSGGKCLTTYGYSSGGYVMIYDCDTAVPDATKWEIRSDGTIMNPKSGLVLTALEDKSGMLYLAVDDNFYGPGQAWYASNNTEPSMTTIVGYKGLCLLASGDQVWLETCVSKDVEEELAIYPDGTIRPLRSQDRCLKYTDIGDYLVSVGRCAGGIEERWRFRSDGTIFHVATGKVMDVKDTSAALPKITVNKYNEGRSAQIWFQV